MRTQFHTLTAENRLSFTRFKSLPDGAKPGFYPGVLVIEKGPAKGHYAVKDGDRVVNFDADNAGHAKLQHFPIVIGDSTLDDITQCGNEADDGTTKCKLDHGSSVLDIVGDYTNFRREGDQVRADLTLDPGFKSYEHAVTLIKRSSKKIGNSIDFDYVYEIQGEFAVARCAKLNSVDIVDAPAATNSLFKENPQPTTEPRMALSKEEIAEIGGMLDTKISSQLGELKTEFNTRFEEMKTKMDEGEDDKEKKEKKKDDESEGNDKMSEGKLNKAVLSALREVFPKAAVERLTSPVVAPAEEKDDYATKFAQAKDLGLNDAQATRLMAKKHPHLYVAKFGGGEGGRGSAKTKL